MQSKQGPMIRGPDLQSTSVGWLHESTTRSRREQKDKLVQLQRRLLRMLGLVPVSDEITRQVVYRVTEASEVKDWERRIIELGDGKSIGQIMGILYEEELESGAWMVDIGLWKNLFEQSVVKEIGELADRGYICLKKPGDGG